MSCIPIETDEYRIRELEQRLKAFREFAVAHEKLEAEMLTDGDEWFEEMLEQFEDGFNKVQSLRNTAMNL